MFERKIKAALVLRCKIVHCILVNWLFSIRFCRNWHKKATCGPATRCHWLFQSSMVACSGRPVHRDGTTTKGMGGNQQQAKQEKTPKKRKQSTSVVQRQKVYNGPCTILDPSRSSPRGVPSQTLSTWGYVQSTSPCTEHHSGWRVLQSAWKNGIR